ADCSSRRQPAQSNGAGSRRPGCGFAAGHGGPARRWAARIPSSRQSRADRHMNPHAPRWPLFIGVDGGGTGCRARIEDADGHRLGTGIAGPATVRLGIDRSLAEVETACKAAAAEAGLPPSALAEMEAGVGLAGIGRKGIIDEI